jgi:hypothetical protein
MDQHSIKVKETIVRKELNKYKADAYIFVSDVNRE